MKIIDAHNHVTGTHPDFLLMMEAIDLKIVNICVSDGMRDWRTQRANYSSARAEFPQRFAWCTAFDPPAEEDDTYVERACAELTQDQANGAVACKVWKNYGMGTRRADGEDMLVDDPALTPIFEHLASIGLPVIMHLADPVEAWLPLDSNMIHYGYYSQHPQYHVYGREDVPSHAEIIAARDRVVTRHPDLRVIGAHMLSLEHDVREVAARFERYPHLAADTSARLVDVAWQDRETVREFFLRWHDRLLFGADWGSPGNLDTMPNEQRREYTDGLQAHYQLAVRFFSTDDEMEVRGRRVQGLGLPGELCEELFVENARRWLPGV